MSSVAEATALDDWSLDDFDIAAPQQPQQQPAAATPTRDAPTPREQPKRGASASSEAVVYFDIETIPDFARAELFGLPPVAEPQAETPNAQCPQTGEVLGLPLDKIDAKLAFLNPDDEFLDRLVAAENTTAKPRKGAFDAIAKCRDAKKKAAGAMAERIKLLSVTPEFCKVCSVAFLVGDDDKAVTLVLDEEQGITEAKLLGAFWEYARKHATLCGFNVLGFDLPVILVRSALLGVLPSKMLNLSPYASEVIDLMLKRFSSRGGRTMGLKALCRVYGLTVDVEDVDGSKVWDLWQAGDREAIAMYNGSDVFATRRLHKFYAGYFCV